MNISSEFIHTNAAQLAQFFQHSWVLSTLLVDDKLRICGYNACWKHTIWQGRDVAGVYLPDLLAPESREVLPLAQGTDHLNERISFHLEVSQPLRINIFIMRTQNRRHNKRADNGYMLIGGDQLPANAGVLETMTLMANEVANMARDLKHKNAELQQAQAQIKTLEGIIPICMHCKEIRNDEGYWVKLEEYIASHSNAQLTHGICDKCMQEYHSDMDEKEKPHE